MLQLDFSLLSMLEFYASPVMFGVYISFGLFLVLAYVIENHPEWRISILFDLLYEKVSVFYGDILGEEAHSSVKTYVVTLFFVIFLINIFSVLVSFFSPLLWISEKGNFLLDSYLIFPTSDVQFNIALSFFSTLLVLYVQFGSLGYKKFFYSYVPIFGKGYLEVEKGKLPSIAYYPLKVGVKIGDIIISLFLWFLDIIGLFAKVISLAFRLFGNMTSGTVLLGMIIVWISSFSHGLTEFIWGINLPIILPIIVYLQGLLVAVIQAMVFPLLVAIFIRMAKMEA